MTKNVLQALQAANDAVEAAIVQTRRTHDAARDAMTRCEVILESLQNSKAELVEAATAIGFSITVASTHDARCDCSTAECIGHPYDDVTHGEWNVTGQPLPQRVPAEIQR